MSDPAMNDFGYRVPAGHAGVEESIRRSRFVTRLAPAATVEEAKAFIDGLRAEHADATHNCWAYLVGPPGSTAQVGYSDDGEPHGTAGPPMLTALLHSGVGDIAAVCTRYYGGVKLGTGGLARAYSGGVKSALEALDTALRVDRVALTVRVAYADIDAVRRVCEAQQTEVRSETFGSDIVLAVGVPEPLLGAFEGAVGDATRGSATVARDDDQGASGDR